MIERYAELLPVVRAVARTHGYAIGLHGSGVRDLDLIAVPWVAGASVAHVLVEAIRAAINGHIQEGYPLTKGRGRLVWSIRPLDNNPDASLYIDLSVFI